MVPAARLDYVQRTSHPRVSLDLRRVGQHRVHRYGLAGDRDHSRHPYARCRWRGLGDRADDAGQRRHLAASHADGADMTSPLGLDDVRAALPADMDLRIGTAVAVT